MEIVDHSYKVLSQMFQTVPYFSIEPYGSLWHPPPTPDLTGFDKLTTLLLFSPKVPAHMTAVHLTTKPIRDRI